MLSFSWHSIVDLLRILNIYDTEELRYDVRQLPRLFFMIVIDISTHLKRT